MDVDTGAFRALQEDVTLAREQNRALRAEIVALQACLAAHAACAADGVAVTPVLRVLKGGAA